MLNQQNNGGGEQRNMFIAMGLSVILLMGWMTFFGPQPPTGEELAAQQAAAELAQTDDPFAQNEGPAKVSATGVVALEGTESRDFALAGATRAPVTDEAIEGTISLKGGVIDDILLPRFNNELDPASGNVELLQPANTDKAYFVEMGWINRDVDISLVPNLESEWKALSDGLTRDQPLTLVYDAGTLSYERTFEILDDYLIKVTQKVINKGDATVTLAPFARTKRIGEVKTEGNWLVWEGTVGHADGSLQRIHYNDLEGVTETVGTVGGWTGLTDKYWLTAVMPFNQQEPISVSTQGYLENRAEHKTTGVLYSDLKIAPGASEQAESLVYIGAKEVFRLDDYSEQYNIARFDMAIDYGWFYYLTKPFAKALILLKGVTGNFGWAIIALTFCIKILFFPLAWRAYTSMAGMRRLAPKIQELRELYGDDRQKISQETMALYKKEGANPVSGCLPMLLQIPVFFALYKTLFVTIEMRHAPFIGWIKDLSAPDPTSILNLFGLLPWEIDPSTLGILAIFSLGVWPILMGVTMYAQQKLNPPPTDPNQAMIFNLLPIVFTFMLAGFSAGLVIYWTANNVLTFIQQFFIMRFADSRRAAEIEERTGAKKSSGGSGSAQAASGQADTIVAPAEDAILADGDADGIEVDAKALEDQAAEDSAIAGQTVKSAASKKKARQQKGKKRR